MENTNAEILLVEDNQQDAELTIRTLRKNNILKRLVHAKDGAEALDYIFCKGTFQNRNFLDQPKVILLDLKMPRIDGLEVLQEIKSNERTKQIPVVILTSSKENPDVERAYRLGANSYIVKPVDFEQFTSAVSEIGLYWMILNQPRM